MKVRKAILAIQIIIAGALMIGLLSSCGKFENPLAPPQTKEALAPKVKEHIKEPPLEKTEKKMLKKQEKMLKKLRKEFKKEDKKARKELKKHGLENALDHISDTGLKMISSKLKPFTTVITPSGGKATSSDGVVTLDIPDGALTETTTIFILGGKLIKQPRGEFKSRIYAFKPEGLQFLKPVKIEFKYDERYEPYELVPAYFDAKQYCWIYLPYTRDSENNTITTYTNHFSTYALIDPAPPAPSNLRGAVNNDGTIYLRWGAPIANDIVGYNIYRNGTKVNRTLVFDENYLDVALYDGQQYTYQVTAVDGSGNESDSSEAFVAVAVDVVPPDTPAWIEVTPGYNYVYSVYWDTCTNPDFAGYRVYYKSYGGRHLTLISGPELIQDNKFVFDDKTNYTLSFVVKVYDINGNVSSIASKYIQSVPPQYYANYEPKPPTNIRGTESDNQVSISWSAAVPGNYLIIIEYRIYKDGYMIGKVPPSQLSFDYTVENGVPHTYYVTSYAKSPTGGAAEVESKPSDTIVLMAHDNVPPAAPTGLTVASVGDNVVRLYWDPPVDNDFVTFHVYVDDKFYASTVDPLISVTGLENKKDYTFYIKALDSSGNLSAPSNSIVAQSVDMEVPSAPYGLQVLLEGDNVVKIAWSADKPADFYAYRVYRDGVLVATLTAEEYLDSGLVNLQTYTYTVSVVDDDGNVSEQSAPINATPVDNIAPGAVSNLSAVLDDRNATISWAPATINEDGSECNDLKFYKVHKEALNLVQEWILPANQTYFYDTELQYDVQYTYYVSAIDDDNNEGAISNISIVPVDKIPPAAPTGLSYTPDYEKIHLRWVANTEPDLAGYNIYRDGVKVNTELIADTQYTDAGLTPGQSYVYTITAVDLKGNESLPSAELQAATYQSGQMYLLWKDGTAIASTGNSVWVPFDLSKFYVWTGVDISDGHIVNAIDGDPSMSPDDSFQTHADDFDVIIKFPEVRRVSRIYFDGCGYEPYTYDYEFYYGTDSTDYNNTFDALNNINWNLVPAPNAAGSDGNYRIQLFPGVKLYNWDYANLDVKLDQAIYTKYIRIHFKRTSLYSIFVNAIYIYN